jgi:hypothetical protein
MHIRAYNALHIIRDSRLILLGKVMADGNNIRRLSFGKDHVCLCIYVCMCIYIYIYIYIICHMLGFCSNATMKTNASSQQWKQKTWHYGYGDAIDRWGDRSEHESWVVEGEVKGRDHDVRERERFLVRESLKSSIQCGRLSKGCN